MLGLGRKDRDTREYMAQSIPEQLIQIYVLETMEKISLRNDYFIPIIPF